MKKLIYLLVLFCPMLFAASYSDDFTGYTGALEAETNWAGVTDGFDCSSGVCTGDTGQTSENLALWDSGTMDTSEYYVSVDVTNGNLDGGVVLSSNAAGDDFITCIYNGQWSSPGMEIRDESSLIASQGSSGWGNNVEVKCEWDADGDVNMYIDDANVLTATTPASPGAYVGLYGKFDSGVTYDNFAAVDTGATGGPNITPIFNHIINQ